LVYLKIIGEFLEFGTLFTVRVVYITFWTIFNHVRHEKFFLYHLCPNYSISFGHFFLLHLIPFICTKSIVRISYSRSH